MKDLKFNIHEVRRGMGEKEAKGIVTSRHT